MLLFPPCNDVRRADVNLVLGSSLQMEPAALLPASNFSIPQRRLRAMMTQFLEAHESAPSGTSASPSRRARTRKRGPSWAPAPSVPESQQSPSVAAADPVVPPTAHSPPIQLLPELDPNKPASLLPVLHTEGDALLGPPMDPSKGGSLPVNPSGEVEVAPVNKVECPVGVPVVAPFDFLSPPHSTNTQSAVPQAQIVQSMCNTKDCKDASAPHSGTYSDSCTPSGPICPKHLAIVNLQPTAFDSLCTVRIFAHLDHVMQLLCDALDVRIDPN